MELKIAVLTIENAQLEGAKKLGVSAMDNSGLEVAQMLAEAKDKRLKALYICHA